MCLIKPSIFLPASISSFTLEIRPPSQLTLSTKARRRIKSPRLTEPCGNGSSSSSSGLAGVASIISSTSERILGSSKCLGPYVCANSPSFSTHRRGTSAGDEVTSRVYFTSSRPRGSPLAVPPRGRWPHPVAGRASCRSHMRFRFRRTGTCSGWDPRTHSTTCRQSSVL